MGKPQFKNRVVLEGGSLLGSIIYFLDKDKRGCFKFSLKPKIGGTEMMFEGIKDGKRTNITPHTDTGRSVDVSYKFSDNLLEFKMQKKVAKTQSIFLKMPSVPDSFLFSVRLKNWERLPAIPSAAGQLELKPPTSESKIAIIFSFLNKDGKATLDRKGHLDKEGRTIIVNLPHEAPFDKILIGVIADPENDEPYDVTIKAPNYPLHEKQDKPKP